MKKTESKQNKFAKVGKVIADIAMALTSTIASAIVAVILYVIYVPFGIGRALFNRRAIRGFYSDVFFAIDGINQRIHKREEEESR